MTENNILTGPEIASKNGNKPEYLCIILHGYGADGENLISLADYIQPHFPSMHFLAPNAPFNSEIGGYGYQWFSLFDRTESKMYQGANTAEKFLDQYINYHLSRFNLSEENLIIIGFSQGTMMALHHMLKRPKPCKMIIGFSGLMLGVVEDIQKNIKSTPKICLIHGEQDEVVPYWTLKNSEQKLKACNLEIISKTIPYLGHSIDNQGLEFAIAELKKIIK